MLCMVSTNIIIVTDSRTPNTCWDKINNCPGVWVFGWHINYEEWRD